MLPRNTPDPQTLFSLVHFRVAWLLGTLVLSIATLLGFADLLQTVRAQNNPAKADEACLTCHGQPKMKSAKGKNLSIDPAKHAKSAHAILACQDCHTGIREFPHPSKVPKAQCDTCHSTEKHDSAGSVHSLLGQNGCASCHGDVHEVTPASKLMPSKCKECHSPEVLAFERSVHGQANHAGDHSAPTCASCHGATHRVLSSADPASKVAKKALPDTCGTCHSDPEFLANHKIPFAHPVEFYKQSVHGRAVAAGNDKAASCSDCHGSHAISNARDPQAKINHWNVAETCSQCHAAIAKTYLESIHGQAMKAGNRDAPVCTDCHGEHLILGPKEPSSPVNVSRVSTVTCGRCHGDERLAQRYNLPVDRLPSYADSFHGLAMREGSQTVANCASCHGVHNIFPSSDSRSTVYPANLHKTCGNCHAGAGDKFAIGPVHVQMQSGSAHPVVHWIRKIYLVLIPLTLAFMVLHNLIDLLSKMLRPRPRLESGERVLRMNLWFRIAHWGVVLSFPTLVFTGFALRYPEAWFARPFLLWERQLAFRGWLHRVAAILLLASTVYHFIHLVVNRRDRAILKAMLPRFWDVRDLVNVMLHNLGLSKDQPVFGKFNYAEKLEYWAFLWGTVVMAVSGFLLWFNNFTLRHFPKWVTDAATAIHFYEAVLATFSILLWHFYIVIFDPVVYPMDLSWLTGKVPANHYRHARPQYFCALERAGLADSLPNAGTTSGGEGSKNQSETLPLGKRNNSGERG